MKGELAPPGSRKARSLSFLLRDPAVDGEQIYEIMCRSAENRLRRTHQFHSPHWRWSGPFGGPPIEKGLESVSLGAARGRNLDLQYFARGQCASAPVLRATLHGAPLLGG